MAGKKRGEVGRLRTAGQTKGVPGTPKQGNTREGKPTPKSQEFIATSDSEPDAHGPRGETNKISQAQEKGKKADFVKSNEQSDSEEEGSASDLDSSGSGSSCGTPGRVQASRTPTPVGDTSGFPSLVEVSDEELLAKTDAEFVQQLLRAQQQGLNLDSAQVLLSSFQRLKEFAVRQALKVARLEGELRGGGRPQRPMQTKGGAVTYSQVAATAAGSPQQTVKAKQDDEKEPSVLLVESTDPQAIQPGRVGEFLRKSFQPEKLGLKKVTLRPTAKGVAVMSNDMAGLENLAAAIQESSVSQALAVRKGSERKETYKLVGVDPEVGIDALIPQLLKQNDLEGEAEECRVLKEYVGRRGERIVIVSVPKQVSRQLLPKKKVHLGWTVCAVYVNPNLTKCTNCARYGHLKGACRDEHPTCMKCSGRHNTENCKAAQFNCPACRSHGMGSGCDHSMWSVWCPVYREMVAKATKYWG